MLMISSPDNSSSLGCIILTEEENKTETKSKEIRFNKRLDSWITQRVPGLKYSIPVWFVR